jgi:hypothetical protein
VFHRAPPGREILLPSYTAFRFALCWAIIGLPLRGSKAGNLMGQEIEKLRWKEIFRQVDRKTMGHSE